MLFTFKKANFCSYFLLLCNLLNWYFKAIIYLSTKLPYEELDPWVTLSLYWLLKHPVFLILLLPLTQFVRLLGVAHYLLCSTCVTYGLHATPLVIECFPPQPLPKDVEDFPKGGNYFKHVPLFTYLICFTPKVLLGRFYICVRNCYRRLYQPLSGFEPTILLIALFVVRLLSYQLGQATLE